MIHHHIPSCGMSHEELSSCSSWESIGFVFGYGGGEGEGVVCPVEGEGWSTVVGTGRVVTEDAIVESHLQVSELYSF